MALDKSRLGLENQFLEKKSGRIFCVRQVYFTKLANKTGGVWTNLLYFLYITSEVKKIKLSLNLKVYVLSRPPGVWWRKSLKVFFLQPNL